MYPTSEDTRTELKRGNFHRRVLNIYDSSSEVYMFKIIQVHE